MTTFDITSIIQLWLLPPGLIILMIVLGLTLSSSRPRLGKAIIFLSLILFWVLSTSFFASKLFEPLESQYPALVVRGIKHKDNAIVVLGAGVNTAATMLRVKYAAAFANKVPIPIIPSGGNKIQGITEASNMKSVLQDQYHLSVLSVEDTSKNTEEEAINLLPILKQQNIKEIYLVTNAFHMPRSMVIFKKIFANSGIKVTAAPMGRVNILSSFTISNYMPKANAFNASEIGLHEYLGLIWAYIK